MANDLDLPDDFRWTIYDAVVARLQADPDLKRTVRPKCWHTYSGRAGETATPGSGGYPAIIVKPGSGPVTPETPVLQAGVMTLTVSVLTQGLNFRDLIKLWGAVERAAFAGQARLDLMGDLRRLSVRPVNVSLAMQALGPELVAEGSGAMGATGIATVNYLI